MKSFLKRITIGLLLFLNIPILFAQVPEGKLWVLIIGISDYEFIRPLTYADDDALAFYEFVRENYADQIDESEFGNVRILLNKQATGASITNAFKWLITNAKENDRAIIYFSGHGGTEDLTIKKRGYLMGYDCFDKSYCNGGTMPLSYLNDILETLAFKNIRTLFVADACHAGKANEDDMTYLNTVLSGEMGSITKILSAQGQERSWESPKWGGGHGVFTYYLIQGLIGGADNDPTDNAITLREINSYLDDNVPAETNYQQNPKILGSIRNQKLSDIRPGRFLALQNEFGLKGQSSMLAAREADAELEIPDNVREIYTKLKRAVEADDLYAGFTHYDELKKLTDITQVLQNAQGLLYSGSMNLSQKYINGFLEIDHYNSEIQEEQLFDYMSALLKILPTDDTDIAEVQARKLFFEAEKLHWGYHDDKVKKAEIKAFIPKLNKIIALGNESAYLHYQVGVLNYHIGENEEAIKYSKEAVALAPNWGHPYNSWANALRDQKKPDEALKVWHTGLRVKGGQDDFLLNQLATVYYFDKNNYDSAFQISKRHIQAAILEEEINTDLMNDVIRKMSDPTGEQQVTKEEYDSVYQMAQKLLYQTEIYRWADIYMLMNTKTQNKAYYQQAIDVFLLLECAALIEYLYNHVGSVDVNEYEVYDASYYFGVLKNLSDLYRLDPAQVQLADFYTMRYRLFKDTFSNGDKGAFDAAIAYIKKYPEHFRSLNVNLYPEMEPYGLDYEVEDE